VVTHKVFVSYYHNSDQKFANEFRDFYGTNNALIDRSLPDEIDSNDDDYVLQQIRSKHLRDSTVTVVLIGRDTWSRKWVDWEIYSSLRPYGARTVNGLLGISLPGGALPPRFEDNYREEELFGRLVQTGYAKLVHWSDVEPPVLWRLWPDSDEVRRRRDYLRAWVHRAFENRFKTNLIVNSRQRFKRNRPVNPHWW